MSEQDISTVGENLFLGFFNISVAAPAYNLETHVDAFMNDDLPTLLKTVEEACTDLDV